jgi:hypothetical protein
MNPGHARAAAVTVADRAIALQLDRGANSRWLHRQ